MADIAKLGVEVDASSVTRANAALKTFEAEAAKAEAAQVELAAASKKSAAEVAAAQQALAAATTAAAAAAKKAAADTVAADNNAAASKARRTKAENDASAAAQRAAAAETRAAAAESAAMAAAATAAARLAQEEQRLAKATADAARATTQAEQAQLRAAKAMEQAEARAAANATATIGLQGAYVRLRTAVAAAFAAMGVGALVKTATDMQRVMLTLQFVTGSATDAKKAFDEFSRAADGMGANILATAPAFAQFAASAKLAGLNVGEAQNVFEGVSAAMLTMGRSTEDVQGALYALQQILSKGKVMAEEVTQQLGERLPGSISLAAQAMGMTSAQFIKAMQDGKLNAVEFVTTLGDALRDRFLPQVQQSMDGATAKLNEFDNAWDRLKITVVQSGFTDAMITTLTALADALNSPLLIAGADALGEAFRVIGEHLTTIIAAGAVIAIVRLGQALMSTAVSAERLSKAMAFFGGPWGIVLATAAAAIVELTTEVDRAEEASKSFNDAMEATRAILGTVPEVADGAAAAISGVGAALDEIARIKLQTAINDNMAAIDQLKTKIASTTTDLTDALQAWRELNRNARGPTAMVTGSGPGSRAPLSDLERQSILIESAGLPTTSAGVNAVLEQMRLAEEAFAKLGESGKGAQDAIYAARQALGEYGAKLAEVERQSEALTTQEERLNIAISSKAGLMSGGGFGASGLLGGVQPGVFPQSEEDAAAQKMGEDLEKFRREATQTQDSLLLMQDAYDAVMQAFKAGGVTIKQAQDDFATIAIYIDAVKKAQEDGYGTNQEYIDGIFASMMATKKINDDLQGYRDLLDEVARMNSVASGGMDEYTEAIETANEALRRGLIDHRTWNAEVNRIQTTGLDAYRAALEDGNAELANTIKLQLVATATMQDGMADMGAAAVGVMTAIESALQSVIDAGKRAGGVLAIVASAAQGVLNWVRGFFGGGEGDTGGGGGSNIDALLAKLAEIEKHIGGGGRGGGGGGGDRDRKAALDEYIASLEEEVEQVKLSGEGLALREAMVRANDAAQRDFNDKLRSSAELTEEETAAIEANVLLRERMNALLAVVSSDPQLGPAAEIQRLKDLQDSLSDPAVLDALAEAGYRVEDVYDAVGRKLEEVTDKQTPLKKAAADVGSAMTSAFKAIVLGGEDALSVLSDLLLKLAEIAFQASIFGSTASGGLDIFGSLASGFLGLFSAKGNVFGPAGHIQAYAKGGIFDRPRLFAHGGGLGVMGEAGPEAAMPLKRLSDGRLGVATDGAAGGTTVYQIAPQINVEVPPGTTEAPEMFGERVAKSLDRQIRLMVREEIASVQRSGARNLQPRGAYA